MIKLKVGGEPTSPDDVDHLHEHFVDPVSICNGRYLAPSRPGFSAAMRPESLQQYRYPDGPARSEA